MAVTTDSRTTLLDYAKMMDPDGKPAVVIEILDQVLAMLQDAPAYPANAPFGNRTTLRASLPTVQFAKINKGTKRSKGTWEQRNDPIGIIDGLSEVDTRMRKVIGQDAFNAERFRQDKGFIQAFAQLAGLTLVYGNTATDEASFDGVAPRMASLNAGANRAASQVWSMAAGGQAVVGGDGTSMFIYDWGEEGASLIFPPNTVAGVQAEDQGDVRVTDKNGDPFMAAATYYSWWVGLRIADPRHIGRVSNIDISDANLAAPLQGSLLMTLIDVLTEMPDPMGMNRVIYAPSRIHAAYWKQAINKANAALTIQDYLGKPTLHAWGYPMRRHDQISLSEGTVT